MSVSHLLRQVGDEEKHKTKDAVWKCRMVYKHQRMKKVNEEEMLSALWDGMVDRYQRFLSLKPVARLLLGTSNLMFV